MPKNIYDALFEKRPKLSPPSTLNLADIMSRARGGFSPEEFKGIMEDKLLADFDTDVPTPLEVDIPAPYTPDYPANTEPYDIPTGAPDPMEEMVGQEGGPEVSTEPEVGTVPLEEDIPLPGRKPPIPESVLDKEVQETKDFKVEETPEKEIEKVEKSAEESVKKQQEEQEQPKSASTLGSRFLDVAVGMSTVPTDYAVENAFDRFIKSAAIERKERKAEEKLNRAQKAALAREDRLLQEKRDYEDKKAERDFARQKELVKYEQDFKRDMATKKEEGVNQRFYDGLTHKEKMALLKNNAANVAARLKAKAKAGEQEAKTMNEYFKTNRTEIASNTSVLREYNDKNLMVSKLNDLLEAEATSKNPGLIHNDMIVTLRNASEVGIMTEQDYQRYARGGPTLDHLLNKYSKQFFADGGRLSDPDKQAIQDLLVALGKDSAEKFQDAVNNVYKGVESRGPAYLANITYLNGAGGMDIQFHPTTNFTSDKQMDGYINEPDFVEGSTAGYGGKVYFLFSSKAEADAAVKAGDVDPAKSHIYVMGER